MANVIWCTGFGPDFSWIDLPVFGEHEHEPMHWRWGNVPIPEAHLVGLERPNQLVDGGPYALSRNPMYAAWTLGYVGVALVAGTAWPLLLLPVVLAATQVAEKNRRGNYPLLSISNLYRIGGLAASPGSCRIIAGRSARTYGMGVWKCGCC